MVWTRQSQSNDALHEIKYQYQIPEIILEGEKTEFEKIC